MPTRHLAILLVAMVLLVLFPHPAKSQSTPVDELTEQVAHDLRSVGLNTPVWLSTHLPAMMNQAGLGSGVRLEGEEFGLAISLIPLRMGLMNQFKDVGQDTPVLGFDKALPDNLPWLTFGAALGLSIWRFELAVDGQFIPDIDLALGENISVKVGVAAVNTALRWRINDASGPVPAFSLGLGFSYYSGTLDMGAGFSKRFTTQSDAGEIAGSYALSGSPEMRWDLTQLSPELKIAWKLGPVRPFMGVALGFSFGEVIGGNRVNARVEIDTIAGQSPTSQPEPIADSSDLMILNPAKFTLRPFVGLDFVFGPIGISAQADLAVVTQEEIGSGFTDAASGFAPSPSSPAGASSYSDAALLLTVALRLVP